MSAGLTLRTCQRSFCHADFEFRQKSINSYFLRIHISAMLFCTSDIPWNFREASARIHFPLFLHCFLCIQCSVELPGGICQHSFYHILHRLSRIMSGDEKPGERDWRGWKSDRILSLTGLEYIFFSPDPFFFLKRVWKRIFLFPDPFSGLDCSKWLT